LYHRRWRRSIQLERNCPLLHSPEANHDFGGISLAGADKHGPREPLQVRRGRFKGRNRPEVDQLRIDRLTFEELLHHRWCGVTHAGVLHVDQLTLLGLEGVTSIELAEAIGANDLPVGAAGHDLALDVRPLEGSPEDGDNPPLTTRHLTDHHGRADSHAQLERKRESRRWRRSRTLRARITRERRKQT